MELDGLDPGEVLDHRLRGGNRQSVYGNEWAERGEWGCHPRGCRLLGLVVAEGPTSDHSDRGSPPDGERAKFEAWQAAQHAAEAEQAADVRDEPPSRPTIDTF
jgi:hypothetical protein